MRAAAAEAAEALFTDAGPGPLAAPRVGPVQLADDGSRRLVASRTVQPGELLMAVRPLALAWDEQYDKAVAAAAGGSGAAPLDPADAKFLSLQAQLLGRRYRTSPGWGGAAGGANCLEPDGGGEDEHVFWARREAAAAAAAAAGAGAGAEPSSSSPSPSGPRTGPLGVWPEAALLRHSCSPNTVAYVVGEVLFVRAARKIGPGAGLTASLLPVGAGTGPAGGGGGGGAAADGIAAQAAEDEAGEGEGGGGGGGGRGRGGRPRYRLVRPH
ncbi:hypothetical protein GPECTOR_231g523 [Gonium pectorale]|uniref:SET domain-containing protein n=1 Tax=Gonium pectorale TaxID=33097 RepID=A0A150FWK1_GONPE|nr:hypothetical protein GPECTOR_231g523 [Gonium pectorale]|eukprot:KXZ41976.1 hypothetical protein GPECTOR_231g523 [Gonium pectorale]